MKTLYISYFGLREPLVQTQVIPYLREIARDGVEVTLLTFEPHLRRSWPEQERLLHARKLDGLGIAWHCLAYHKSPSIPATLYDIAVGALFTLQSVVSNRIDVVHARTHVPMLMALIARMFVRCRLVFDIRGFVADEYADVNKWKEGSLAYR